MRILKIELQNINSLKSKTPIVIDFESEHFKDVGLYAITGSTGAGKTTILDAITIALYHSVPRFNSSTAKANLRDVVSYGANGAMARVGFENRGKRYEAHWSMRLTTAAGKPLTNPKEEVRLKDLSTGQIIAEKKMGVKAEVERVTQLNYHQFLRSAMLAQGEFAAFLSASSQDKGKLLEQITGEDIYKKIGETIGAKIAEERGKLEKIRAKINAEDLLTAEQAQELKAEQEGLKKELETLASELKEVELVMSWYKKQGELIKEEERLAHQKAHLEAEKMKNQQISISLERHEKAEPHKALLDTIKRLEKEDIERQEDIKKLVAELKTIATKITEAQQQEVKAKTRHQEHETAFSTWLPKLDRVGKLDASILNGHEKKQVTQKSLDENKEQIKRLQKAFESIETEQEQNIKKRETADVFLGEQKDCLLVEQHLTHWHSELTIRHKNHTKSIAERAILNEKEKALTNNREALKETAEQFGVQQTKLSELNIAFEKIVVQLKANPIAERLTQREELDKKIKSWTEALRRSIESNKTSQSKKDLSLLQKKLDVDFETLTQKDKELQDEKVKAEIAFKDAEKILELERQILRFDAERKKLTEGSPCALCGSKEHPYVSQYENATLSKSQTTLEERKRTLDLIEKETKSIALLLVENKTKNESIVIQINSLNEELSSIENAFALLKIGLPIDATENIKKTVTDLEKQSRILSTKISEGQQLQKNKDLQDAACKTQTDLVHNLKTKQATLTEKQESLEQELKQRQTEFATLIQETKDLESQLRDDLASFKLALPLIEESSAFVKTQEQRIASYHTKEKDQVNLKNKITQGTSEIKNNREQFNEKHQVQITLEKEQHETDAALRLITTERTSILPMNISIIAKREELQNAKEGAKKVMDQTMQVLQTLNTQQVSKTKETENLQKDQTKSRTEISTASLNLSKAIEDSDFESRESLENALLSVEEKTQHLQIVKTMENSALTLKTLEQRLKMDIEKLAQKKTFDFTINDATKKQIILEKDKTKLTERTGEIRQKFELDRQIKERNQSVTHEISAQEIVLKKWTDLMTLLGGSKHAFNTYVQRLTLHNLIQLANVHLFKLNKRYSLRLDPTYKPGEELFFKLIDHYQTDEARYVDTSSGGEKFLISLALALGLSDLSSNNVNIDSLFIDEGFGTLDSQTLETVISSLETLQAQGKMIGIISHVENLKERIPTQIQVLKKSNGISEVAIA